MIDIIGTVNAHLLKHIYLP